MPEPLPVTRYTLADDAGRLHAINGCLILYDSAHRARRLGRPGLKVVTVRVTAAPGDGKAWYVTVRRRWVWWGPVELVETLGMSQARDHRQPPDEGTWAVGEKVSAVRIVTEG